MEDRRNYLPEIDGLRALAVAAVIVSHYFEDLMPSGFLGVDIFFVISGFVITSHLKRTSPANWTEYLVKFYSRRMKRLFPALFFCVLLTSFLFLLLTTRPSDIIFKTGAFALLGFSNNYLFLKSADYFSLATQLNPFTHTWSLGVEEQFYLFFPIIFALLGYVGTLTKKTKSKGTFALLLLTAFSLIGYLISCHLSENAAFYLIPNRLWELSIGSLTYLAFEKRKLSHPGRLNSLAIFILLCFVLFLPNKIQFLTTIACVTLTALLLYFLRQGDIPHKILTIKFFVFMGLISYSLYLWHWSLLVLGKWTLGESFYSKIILLMLTFLFAVLSYFFIERPLRYRTWSQSHGLTIVYVGVTAFSLALCNIFIFPGLGLSSNNLISVFFKVPQVIEWWDGLDCHGSEAVRKFPKALEHCLGAPRTQQNPSVIYLIGDSHAAQLVFMARKAFAHSLYSVRFINPEELSDFPHGFIHNQNVKVKTLDYIAENAKKGDYVLIAFHRGQLNESRDQQLPLSQTVPLNGKTKNFFQNASEAIKDLQKKGVKVILIRDTPLMKVVSTSPACLLQLRFFGESICRVSKQQDLHTRSRQDFAFDKLRDTFANVFIWDPAKAIYGQKEWLDVVDDTGNYIMSDWHHLSLYQSELLSEDFKVFFRSTMTVP
ncbi:acyltransferase family protein [Deltaproteobacteria bacterium TL4]